MCLNNYISNYLVSVARFCDSYSELCNAHTVDFIVKNRWVILPPGIREELMKMTNDDLTDLLNEDNTRNKNWSEFPHLSTFLCEAKKHSIENIAEFLPKFPSALIPVEKVKTAVPLNILMSFKKSHEVEAMTSVIASLALQQNINKVVDFGTGKGYLSSHLALNHNLNVLGIDSSEGNCKSADRRSEKLITRFIKKKVKFESDSQGQSADLSSGIFVGKALTIDQDTDFNHLLEHFVVPMESTILPSTGHESPLMFTGLHACGNLYSCMLKHFTTTEQAKVLCSVGCCYQHVNEAFSENPFATDDDDGKPVDFGFPLSGELLKIKYSIGRNARMLASQSLMRIAKNGTEQHRHLYHRAILQVILREHCEDVSNLRVGKLAPKCQNFEEYINKALKRLKLSNIQLSSQELNSYLEKYKEEEKKLIAFHSLRILMAPCLEALILLDRLAFLLEKEEVQQAYLMKLFDPVISPRCYALIAVKA